MAPRNHVFPASFTPGHRPPHNSAISGVPRPPSRPNPFALSSWVVWPNGMPHTEANRGPGRVVTAGDAERWRGTWTPGLLRSRVLVLLQRVARRLTVCQFLGQRVPPVAHDGVIY